MPYGDNDWLALNQEPTLEPELPICDPHHHFWDLRSERIPYQRYLLHELAADVNSGHHIRSTVFIETRTMYSPDVPHDLRTFGEVEFLPGLAAATPSGRPIHPRSWGWIPGPTPSGSRVRAGT